MTEKEALSIVAKILADNGATPSDDDKATFEKVAAAAGAISDEDQQAVNLLEFDDLFTQAKLNAKWSSISASLKTLANPPVVADPPTASLDFNLARYSVYVFTGGRS